MSLTRTFVAVSADDALCRAAGSVIERLRPHAPRARWVDADQLHLTLLFLGDLSDAEVADACGRADWAARANQPFTISVAGVRAFPDPSKPRAVWLGVQDGVAPLERLQADVDDAVGDLASRSDRRPFTPHWTLARLNRRDTTAGGRLIDAVASVAEHPAGRLSVDCLQVIGSELTRDGPEHHVLATCPLGMP